MVIRDEVLVELPSPVRGLRVARPLLINIRTGVGEDAMVELRVVPSHDERAGTAGASAHSGAGLGVVGELDVIARLNRGSTSCSTNSA